MEDYLKYAALAAAMTDDELIAEQVAICDSQSVTGLQQAIIDELLHRGFGSPLDKPGL